MPLTQHDARRDAQARLTYEPLVSNLAYVFMARMVSGKASAGDTQNSRPANKFLREKPENAELVKRLLKACNKEHDPQQFVDAADDNYALRQGNSQGLGGVCRNVALLEVCKT